MANERKSRKIRVRVEGTAKGRRAFREQVAWLLNGRGVVEGGKYIIQRAPWPISAPAKAELKRIYDIYGEYLNGKLGSNPQ